MSLGNMSKEGHHPHPYPTLEMLADGFTKSLPKATLMRHAYDMGQVLPGRSDDAPPEQRGETA